jgi:hypothetical protein
MTPHTSHIIDFIKVAQSNGMVNLWAALPRTHQLVQSGQVGQIRKVQEYVASGIDELGNHIILTTDNRIIQK